MGKENPLVTRMDSIFKLLFEADSPLTSIEIQRQTGIPKSTLLRLLKELETFNYITRKNSSKRYELGSAFKHFGSRDYDSLEVQEAAKSLVQQLASDTGETAKISILFAKKAKVIIAAQGPSKISINVKEGAEFPLHAGAASKVILAFQHYSFIENYLSASPFPRFTDRTITSKPALKKEINAIKSKGLAYDHQEYIYGIEALAFPILVGGRIIASISVPIIPTINKSHINSIAAATKRTAAEISQKLLVLRQAK